MTENTPSLLGNVIAIDDKADEEPPRPRGSRQRGGDDHRLVGRRGPIGCAMRSVTGAARPVAMVKLRMPKLRAQTFETAIIEQTGGGRARSRRL